MGSSAASRGALLLGFAVIAAVIGLRRGLAAEQRRLVLARGARRWCRSCSLRVAELAGMTLTGAVFGIVVGVGVIAAIAGAAGQPVGGILTHALVTGRTIGLLAGGWLAVTALLVASTFARGDETDWAARPCGLSDVAALGALATVAVALSFAARLIRRLSRAMARCCS